MKKCNAVKNKWCDYIKELADFGNPEAVGLAISNVVNINTGARGHGLRLGFPRNRWKELGGKFTWVDFCPFCGSDVSKRTAEAKK